MNVPVSVKRRHLALISGFFGVCALVSLLSPAQGQEVDTGFNAPDNLDRLMSAYQSQGLKIDRLGDNSGAFTVGNEWRNFQDTLLRPDGVSGRSSLFDDRQTSEWTGGNGFSIALEEPAGQGNATNDNIKSLQGLTEGSPNLILSWQGDFAENGRYKMSAIGRKLNLEGVHDGVNVDDEELGWGVQMAGGWRFGDLFAALRVTLGNGIDSLILKRFGSDVAVSSSGEVETLESLTILPSLNYNINKRSDVRLSLGHYKSADGEAVTGIDTLDTINLGYTWSPWPSTRIGVEVEGKDFEGDSGEEDSTEIKIGAETRF